MEALGKKKYVKLWRLSLVPDPVNEVAWVSSLGKLFQN